MSLLDDALADVRRGDGRLVLVHGPAGIGKTALIGASRRLAQEREMLVLFARGEDIEGEYAFGVARQLLARTAQERLDCGKLDGAAALAAPALGIVGEGSASVPRGEDPFSARHGLYWLTSDLAEECPALLAVDDAQWADSPSLQWLAFLARRLDDLPLGLILAVRDEDESDPNLAALAADPSAQMIFPRDLTPDGVATLVAEAVGEDASRELAQEIYAATDGNPLWVNELLRTLSAEGRSAIADPRTAEEINPGSAARAVLVRLGQIAMGSVALAGAVAILGSDVQPEDAAAVAGLTGLIASRARRALVQAGLLVDADGKLSFGHPLVRDAVYADLGAERRAAFHEAAASVLAARGADAEHVAAHLLHVPPGRDAQAAGCLREAAELGLARGAPEVAVEYLQRALEEDLGDGRAAGLHELGMAEARLRGSSATENLLAAYRLATREDRPQFALDAARALAAELRLDEAVAVLGEAVAEADGEDRLRLSAELTTTKLLGGEVSSLPEALPPGGTRGERALLAAVSFVQATQVATFAEALAAARAAWANGRLLAEEGPDSLFVQSAVGVLIVGDAYDEALAWIDQVLAEARRRGSVTSYVLALAIRSFAHYRRGDVGAALADARGAMEAETAHPTTVFTPIAISFLIEALVEIGNTEEAEEALRARGLDGALPPLYVFDVMLARRGRLRVAMGEMELGLEDLLAAIERLEWVTNPFDTRRLDAAQALAALGRDQEARALVDEELELARRAGRPRQIAIVERAAALLNRPVDEERLQRSAELAERACARLEQARALADLGATVRRGGERARAREILHRALDLANQCGGTALADRAREELVAAGGRVRRLSTTGPDALTPSERRVALMAVEGHSNREIAQALFLTPRTIEMHLSHAYGKLEISSRGELPAALGTASGTDDA